MNRIIRIVAALAGVLVLVACSKNGKAVADSCLWKSFPAISEQEGYPAIGVSAMYAGVNNRHLLMAGGANFPNTPVADGGKKAYYKQIFTKRINAVDADWTYVGDLPVTAAYGASVSIPSGVVCLGGNNESGAFNSVLRYQISETGLLQKCDTLPQLPCKIDNFAATNDGNVIYVAGGNIDGIPGNRVFCLDLNMQEMGWSELNSFPGFPRVQPVLTFQRIKNRRVLVLAGGFCGYTSENEIPKVAKDIAILDIESGVWSVKQGPVTPDKKTIALGGACAVAINDSLSLYTGGVNDSIFLSALNREKEMKIARMEENTKALDSLQHVQRDYLLEPASFYQFNPYSLVYNVAKDQWGILIKDFSTARAGAMMVAAADSVYLFNGEAKPGIRTGENLMIALSCIQD